jgi:hypothetical protein
MTHVHQPRHDAGICDRLIGLALVYGRLPRCVGITSTKVRSLRRIVLNSCAHERDWLLELEVSLVLNPGI